jgi:hypothetical protein
MNKAELDFLERVFSAEIDGRFYQTKSKLAKNMEDDGYIQKTSKSFGKDRFGEIVVTGYVLTIKGNYTYCTSERCNPNIPGRRPRTPKAG